MGQTGLARIGVDGFEEPAVVLAVALDVAEHPVGEQADGPVDGPLVDPAHQAAGGDREELGDGADRRDPSRPGAHLFLASFGMSPSSAESSPRNASCGTWTHLMSFMRSLPSFCFSMTLRLREMSPP